MACDVLLVFCVEMLRTFRCLPSYLGLKFWVESLCHSSLVSTRSADLIVLRSTVTAIERMECRASGLLACVCVDIMLARGSPLSSHFGSRRLQKALEEEALE